jgi:hypothetical protein
MLIMLNVNAAHGARRGGTVAAGRRAIQVHARAPIEHNST